LASVIVANPIVTPAAEQAGRLKSDGLGAPMQRFGRYRGKTGRGNLWPARQLRPNSDISHR